jgi:hypothetical protein
MGGFSSIPCPSSSYSCSQVAAKPISPAFLHHDDPQSAMGLERRVGLELGRCCLGGNKYSYDGFFMGRCGCRSVDSGAGDDSGAELWNFEFAVPSLDGDP